MAHPHLDQVLFCLFATAFIRTASHTALCAQGHPRALYSNLAVGHLVLREAEGGTESLVALAHHPQGVDAGAEEVEPHHTQHRPGDEGQDEEDEAADDG